LHLTVSLQNGTFIAKALKQVNGYSADKKISAGADRVGEALFVRGEKLTAALGRKLSFGTQSAAGSRFVETILTVVETCHRQSRNSFDYVASAVQAHFARQPAPSLLPGA
jgi:hypothetical protein